MRSIAVLGKIKIYFHKNFIDDEYEVTVTYIWIRPYRRYINRRYRYFKFVYLFTKIK